MISTYHDYLFEYNFHNNWKKNENFQMNITKQKTNVRAVLFSTQSFAKLYTFCFGFSSHIIL